MSLFSSYSSLCPSHWSQVLSREWRCWSSSDRRCSNHIWVINNLIAYRGAPYIRCFTATGLNNGSLQVIIWTDVCLLLIWNLWTNFSEIWNKIKPYYARKSNWDFRPQTATILCQPQCVKHCFDSYQGPLSLTWNKYNLSIDALTHPIMKCGVKLLIHSHTSTVHPLRFGSG